MRSVSRSAARWRKRRAVRRALHMAVTRERGPAPKRVGIRPVKGRS